MDVIKIHRLKVFCNHGVYEEEKINGQNFYISAALYVNTRKAGTTDNLNDSVNYAEVCHKIHHFMTTNTYNLLEAVAENLAYFILSEYSMIKAIDLTISKPEAPIGLPFDDITVTINRAWHTSYLSIGSNMGDSPAIINDAINKLKTNPYIRNVRVSSIIITKPYGNVEQNDFHNGCIEIETLLSPYDLLNELHEIENAAGRKRLIHWGPRTLDLDIVLYDDRIINSENLTVPHPDMHNRMFVLEPLCEIAPYAYNPVLQKNISILKKELEEKAL